MKNLTDSLTNKITEMITVMPYLKDLNPEEQKQLGSRLLKHATEVLIYNQRFNLIANETESLIVEKHIADSLAPIDFFLHANLQPPVIADVGSGSGFPGLVLSIAFSLIAPDVRFELIERMSKRATFLENCIAQCGLKNCTVINEDLKQVRHKYDIVTCRALSTLDKTLARQLLSITKPKGRLLLYKGNETTADKELATLQKILSFDYGIETIENPLDSKKASRCLAIITPRIN